MSTTDNAAERAMEEILSEELSKTQESQYSEAVFAGKHDDITRAAINAMLRVSTALAAERDALDAQIEKLAKFIMENVPGEPSQSQGAVDTAIRLLSAFVADRDALMEAINLALNDGSIARLSSGVEYFLDTEKSRAAIMAMRAALKNAEQKP